MERFLLVLAALFVAGMMAYAIMLAPPVDRLSMDPAVLEQISHDVPENAWFQEEVLESQVPVLVDFKAVWCGPCKILKASIDIVADKHAGAFKVVQVDVDEHEDLASHFQAQAIPMVLWFENGVAVDGFVGAVKSPELEKFVDRNL